jgi:hypothetical protein
MIIKYGCPAYCSIYSVLERSKVTAFITDLVPMELWVLGSRLNQTGPGRIVLDVVRPNIRFSQTTEYASSKYTMWTCKAMGTEKAN